MGSRLFPVVSREQRQATAESVVNPLPSGCKQNYLPKHKTLVSEKDKILLVPCCTTAQYCAILLQFSTWIYCVLSTQSTILHKCKSKTRISELLKMKFQVLIEAEP